MIDVMKIMEYLPHRYPFLMVDRVLEKTEEKIIAIKNVTINEGHFQGHFPKDPIMPGVLLVEGMAQCGGLLVLMSSDYEDVSNLSTYFTSIDKVKFKQAVRPGDTVRYEVSLVQKSAIMCKFTGQAFVEDKLACRAEFSAAVVKIDDQKS